MSHYEIASVSGKRFFAWIWPWVPHVASTLGTAGLAVGAVLLGADDYSDLSRTTRVSGWTCVGIGLGLTAFATILLASREKSSLKLKGKVDSANGRVARAEELAGALWRALQDGMRSRILQIVDDLEIREGTEFRISLYSHNKRDRLLTRRARYSTNQTLEDLRTGRATVRDDVGLIGLAFAKPKASRYTVRTERGQKPDRPAWHNWMITEGHLPGAVAASLRMQPYHYMFAPVVDSSVGRTIGILVAEFEKASGAPSAAKLNQSIAARERDLAVSLTAIERELELAKAQDPDRASGFGGDESI